MNHNTYLVEISSGDEPIGLEIDIDGTIYCVLFDQRLQGIRVGPFPPPSIGKEYKRRVIGSYLDMPEMERA
jgi:hypothetical protein